MMTHHLSLIDSCCSPRSPSLSSRATSPLSLSSDSVDFSPRSEKLVGICRNCSYSYRISRRTTDEFCSKDCQTNFTLFGKLTGCRTPEKTVAEVRTSIYQFQQRLDSEFQQEAVGTTLAEDDAEEEPLPPKIEKAAKPRVVAPKNFFESLFVSSRRPARPQLHTFI